jgi:pyruvyl transferase EpsO
MTSSRPSFPAAPATSQTHLQVISRLQELINEALAPSLPALRAGPYALMDMPDYGNVGDSAIWAGEIAWLKKNVGSDPALITHHLDPLAQVNRDLGGKTVLFQGGGNFGDLWKEIHNFRQAIIAANPDSTIIQLPQSIHYDDPAGIATTARNLKAAKALRLLVRDHESYALATEAFDCEVTLCPDMAFALGPLQRIGTPDLEVLLLMRTDKEAVGHASQDWPKGWEQDDWLEDAPNLHQAVLRESRIKAITSLSAAKLSLAARRSYYYNQLADRRLQRGLRQLSRARFVITDRLHVHILCTLLGIPHCFLDNHYGKIARFSAAFSTNWRASFQATSLPNAVDCAKAWLARPENASV